MIAVAVGDVQFVGLRIDKRLGRQPQIRDIVAAFALLRLADLHQEFSVLGELQDHVVVEASRTRPVCPSSSCRSCGRPPRPRPCVPER